MTPHTHQEEAEMARVSEEQRSKTIEMYQAGRKMKEILKETGLPESTAYSVLHVAGVTAKGDQRSHHLQRGGNEAVRMTFDTMVEKLLEQQRRIGELEAELAKANARFKRLKSQT